MAARFVSTALAAALVLAGGATQAKDVELFQTDPAFTGSPPNMLIMLDDSANWSATIGGTTKKELEHQALYEVITDPELLSDTALPKVRMGLMHFSHSNSPRGGKVVKAVEGLTSAVQDEWRQLLYTTGTISPGNEALEKTNNAPYAMMLNEAYRYFAGLDPMSGTADGNHDSAAIDDGRYESPQEDNACGRNFAVLIGNGEPDTGEDNDAESELRRLGGVLSTDPVDVTPSNFESNWADEYARFMFKTDVVSDSVQPGKQNVITYVIDVFDPTSAQAKTKKHQAAREWLKSIADEGQGQYFTASSVADIKLALWEIIREILALNSVFSSTTLPVSVNVRGTNLNQVYMGVFRPDGNSKPRWQGNLKLYQLGADPGSDRPHLVDRRGVRADSQVTGFIVDSAESFWTHSSTDWDFSPSGVPESGSDLPDGPMVEKGGVHQQLRDHLASRRLYTCTGSCGPGSYLRSYPFNTTNASAAALGVSTSSEASELVDWVWGFDNLDEDSDGSFTDPRPSIHGDVLHSQPAVINYGTTVSGAEPRVVAFYGANDGVFRAVEGGKDDLHGNELWGFVAPEFFSSLKILRDNLPATDFGDRPNFADGPVAALRVDVNNDGIIDDAAGDRVYLYLTMRRGGRFLYALDVSDPEDPRLLWQRDSGDTGYGELGQSWSAPQVANIPDLSGTGSRPVLVMGAGYDPEVDDLDPTTASPPAHDEGRGILVVNALTGDVLWQVGPAPTGAGTNLVNSAMTHSFPSAPTVIDRNFDGYHDRAYIGDTGGNVWRVDLGSGDPDDWRVHRLASLGSDQVFLYSPDVVYDPDGYDAVLLGAGDREHPFDTSVTNHFYMLKDTVTAATIYSGSYDDIVPSELADVTNNDIQDGTEAEQVAAATALANGRGWRLQLQNGEKAVGSAITLSGTVLFSTHEPSPASSLTCIPSLGIARDYKISYKDARATQENDGLANLTRLDRYTLVPGGGLQPSPTPLIVELNGKKYQAVVSGTQVAQVPGLQLDRRIRSFWYIERE